MKHNKLDTAIILISEITKGMKSIGSKSLLHIDTNITALDYQIQHLNKNYHPNRIILCTGFDHAKIVMHTKKYKNIEYCYNSEFAEDNQTGCLLSCLKQFNPKNTLILTNGLILFDKIKLESISSTYFIDYSKDKKKYFEIGSNDINDESYLFYDLQNKWIELLFLNEDDIKNINNQYKKTSELSKLFLFEFINKIKPEYKIDFIKLDKQRIYPVKINTLKDLLYAKKQYKKYKLISAE